ERRRQPLHRLERRVALAALDLADQAAAHAGPGCELLDRHTAFAARAEDLAQTKQPHLLVRPSVLARVSAHGSAGPSGASVQHNEDSIYCWGRGLVSSTRRPGGSLIDGSQAHYLPERFDPRP